MLALLAVLWAYAPALRDGQQTCPAHGRLAALARPAGAWRPFHPRSTRGNTGTRAGPNGAIGWITGRLDPRVGPLYRETAWLWVGLRADYIA
jgi:hypothetical protein